MTTDPGSPPGDQHGLSEVLAATLGRAATNQRGVSDALLAAISDCIGDLRAKGVPPEDVPEAIRGVVHRARHTRGAPAITLAALEPALERLIAECVLWHYRDGGGGARRGRV